MIFQKIKQLIQSQELGILSTRDYLTAQAKEVLYKKNLYYSEEISSELHKYNMTHFDYSGFASDDENINGLI